MFFLKPKGFTYLDDINSWGMANHKVIDDDFTNIYELFVLACGIIEKTTRCTSGHDGENDTLKLKAW